MPLPATAAVELNTAVAQVASSGPKRRKVIVPVGEKPSARVAVSVREPPTVTGPEAWVTRVGVTPLTVTKSVPRPAARVTIGPCTSPSTRADVAVCTPGPGRTSIVGTRTTSKENCRSQVASLANVDSTTLSDGVNVTIPDESGGPTANVTPWQAPPVPVAVALSANTPGSGVPQGTLPSPHEGQSRMDVSSSGPGRVRNDRLMEIAPTRPVSKIATGSGIRGSTAMLFTT